MNNVIEHSDVLAVRAKQLIDYCTFIVNDNPYIKPIRTGIALDTGIQVRNEKGEEYRISAGTYFIINKVVCSFINKQDNIYRLFPRDELAQKGMTRHFIIETLVNILPKIRIKGNDATNRINSILSWLNANYSATLIWLRTMLDDTTKKINLGHSSALDSRPTLISPMVSQTRFIVRGGYGYHDEFIRTLRNAFSDRKNAAKAIEKYLKLVPSDADFTALDVIVDNFDVMKKDLAKTYKYLSGKSKPCPHYTELVKILSTLKPTQQGGYDIDQVKKYIATNWGEQDNGADFEDDRFYCKQCGALLYIAFTEGLALSSQLQTKSEETDPTWTLVYRNLQQTSKYVKGITSEMVEDLAEIIQPTIDLVMSQLNRIKTMSMKDIRMLKVINAHIYIHAALARFVFVKKMDWRLKIKGITTKPENKSKINAFSLFMNNIGNAQVILSRADVQNLFNKAYETFTHLPFDTIKQRKKQEDENEQDQFYDFARIAYRKANTSIPKLASGLKPLPPAGGNSVVQEYNAYYDFRQKSIFAYSADDQASIDWVRKWGHLSTRNQDIKPKFNITLVKSFPLGSQHISQDIPHIELFCPNGANHDFTMSGAKYIIGNAEKAVSAKELPAGRVWDSKKMRIVCGKCGYDPSAITRKDTATAESARDAMALFFNYVKTYCPVKEEHEFAVDKDGLVGSNPCQWCGYIIGGDNMVYYKKWKKTIDGIIVANAYQPTPKPKTTVKTQQQSDLIIDPPGFVKHKWVFTNSPIMEVSRILSIPSNLFLMIGGMEKEIYSNVEKGLSTPEKIDKLHQLAVVTNYVKSIQTVYAAFNNGKLPTDYTGTAGKNKFVIQYPDIDEYVRLTNFKDVDAAVNYAQCALATTILIGGKEFSKYILKKILSEEKLFTTVQLSKVAAIESKIYEGIADGDGETTDIDADQSAATDERDEFSYDDVDIEHANTGAEDEAHEDE